MKALLGIAALVCLPAFAQDGWQAPVSPTQDGWPASYPPLTESGWPATEATPFSGTVASCDYVDGFCRIDILHPVARRVPATAVRQIGPRTGLVAPQDYASALAGRQVQIVKISVIPAGRRLQAIIEWR